MKNVETIFLFLFFTNLSSSYSVKINVDESVKLKMPKVFKPRPCTLHVIIVLGLSH